MVKAKTQSEQFYGLPQPLSVAADPPIVAKRAPTTSDIGYTVGRYWINTVAGTIYALTANSSGSATWLSLGGSLTPSVTNLTTGAATVSSLLAGNALSMTGSNSNITFTVTPKGTGGMALATGDFAATTGNLICSAAAKGLQLTEGTNGRMGTATLSSGTITVTNTSATANTRVFVSRMGINGSTALGELTVAISAGVSFTITAVSASTPANTVTADTSIVHWILVEHT